MTTAMQPFTFEGKTVRFVGTPESPEWIGADVCAALEIANTHDALGSLADDEKGVATTDTLGGPQEMATVNEAGLYRLVFRSRKSAADRFKRWVCHEVLPSIRKTGSFSVAPTTSLVGQLDELRRRLDAVEYERRLLVETNAHHASIVASLLAKRGVQKKREQLLEAEVRAGQAIMFDGARAPRLIADRPACPKLPKLDVQTLGTVLDRWAKCFAKPVTIREAMEWAKAHSVLDNSAAILSGFFATFKGDASRIANTLRRHRGEVVGGLTLAQAGSTRKGSLWHVGAAVSAGRN